MKGGPSPARRSIEPGVRARVVEERAAELVEPDAGELGLGGLPAGGGLAAEEGGGAERVARVQGERFAHEGVERRVVEIGKQRRERAGERRQRVELAGVALQRTEEAIGGGPIQAGQRIEHGLGHRAGESEVLAGEPRDQPRVAIGRLGADDLGQGRAVAEDRPEGGRVGAQERERVAHA